MRKVFIVGADGYIGSRLVQSLSGKYDIKRVTLDNKNGDFLLNLEKPEEFDFNQVGAGDTIIHLAAISSPDKCTKEYNHAYQVNVIGTSYFIDECLKKGTKVLFFSSDVIYGKSEPEEDDYFDENSQCNPLEEYGKMKREIEEKFLGKNNFKIFRLSYVFSRDDKFTAYLKNCCEKKKTADIFHPFSRSVIYLEDVISAVDKLIGNWEKIKEIVFNLAGAETVSRKKMAELYRKEIGPSLEFKITKPGENFFRNRPEVIRTKSLYLEKLLERPVTELSRAYCMEKESAKEIKLPLK